MPKFRSLVLGSLINGILVPPSWGIAKTNTGNSFKLPLGFTVDQAVNATVGGVTMM